MTPDRVLVVGGGPFQLEIIHAARALDVEVVVVDGRRDAPGLALAHRAAVIDTRDVAAIVTLARELGVRAVVTAASDAALDAVAGVSEALGLPGLAPEVVRRCRDKLETHVCLQAAGLAVPDTMPVRTEHEIHEALELLGGYPVVVKPRSSAGGRGVSIVTEPAGIASALRRALVYAPPGGSVLAQSFVAGRSIGVEAFFRRGEMIAGFVLDDQYQEGFVSPVGHSVPSSLDDTTQHEVLASVACFADALGLREGPANFDLRLAEGRVVLLEINPRLGGSSISDLVRIAYDVDLPRATVLAALGRPPTDALARHGRASAASRLLLLRDERPIDAARVARLRSDTRVERIDLFVDGERRAPLRVDEHVLAGRCIVRAHTAAEAAEACSELSREITGMPTLFPSST